MNDEITRIIKEEKLPVKKVNTIIGINTVFRGNFVVEGPLRIDGNYEGDVKSMDMIIVGSSGKVKGNIYGEVVVIGGGVKGNIFAIKEIILLSTAKVIGDLTSQKILIDEGARLKGRFNRVSSDKVSSIFSSEVIPYLQEERNNWSW
ncbi:MAG: polymer-forming cytoskeletal protein [Spirochaetia bacterium]|nr:polymer-forming cytoskeletal protein [Spirochaetota bacterium]MCX8097131.1 polymer-forming cytoskeletal protein [Spirochaetota bacterium]MDW8112100.1 polymer-forming cytoskeletal protein [Spirochaetia bacterium]